MSTIAGDLVTTTASTATSINYAGQSQLVADGKLDVPVSGQTGDYHLEDRSRYRIQDTESIQSLWANDAWTETGHTFSVDHDAHNAWVYNQTINLPKNSDPILTDNGDGTSSSRVVQLGQDQAKLTSAGGYDYHLTQSGSPKDFLFSLNHTSQSQSAKQDTGTWRAADELSGANYDNLGNETKNSRANLSGRVQNGSVDYTGIDVYQNGVTSTNNAGSGFALGSTTHSNTVGSTQTIESRGGNSGSWYGSKLESGNSTTNYTTVSGTMRQPFSGMTQTGFNTTTLYGTAAQTGTSGAYGSLQTGETGPPTLPNLPAPNVGDYPPDALNKVDRIYNAYRQSAVNQSYYASQYANRPGANFVAPSLPNMLQQINTAVINGSLRPDVVQSKYEFLVDVLQTGLDVLGMVPVVGEFADGANVGIYLIRGNYTDATLSAAAMVPFLGIAATLGKFGRKIGKLEKVVQVNPSQAANLTKVSEGFTEATNLKNGIHRIVPKGARGPATAWEGFDEALAGGPVRDLTTNQIKVTNRGIDVVEQHTSRFGTDKANSVMGDRLRRIANGEMTPTVQDLNFYSHELREFVRYRHLGWKNGVPSNLDTMTDLWRQTHTGSLLDYSLPWQNRFSVPLLYHPDALRFVE